MCDEFFCVNLNWKLLSKTYGYKEEDEEHGISYSNQLIADAYLETISCNTIRLRIICE